MTFDGFLQLALKTVRAPRDVAVLLMSYNLPRQVLWLAFALVVVLNTMMFSLSTLTSPASNLLGPVLGSPVVFGAMLGLSVAGLIFAITVCGRPLGGTATIEQMAVLVIWLQALRVVLQAAVLVLGSVSLFLSGLVVSAGSVIGIWILVNFIDVAHDTGGLLKAAGVLLLAVVAMMLGLSMIFSLLGVQTEGFPGYV